MWEFVRARYTRDYDSMNPATRSPRAPVHRPLPAFGRAVIPLPGRRTDPQYCGRLNNCPWEAPCAPFALPVSRYSSRALRSHQSPPKSPRNNDRRIASRSSSISTGKKCPEPSAVARRNADHLRAPLGRQDERPWETSLWLMNADGTHQRSLVQGSDVQWSPDGKRIAYIAQGRAERHADLRSLDGRRGRVDADLASHGSAVEPRVVAGRQVDRVHDERAGARQRGASRCRRRRRARSGPSRRRSITRLNYRSDRVGYTDDAYRHIFLIPADGGTPRQITNGDWNHSAPAFSADGKWLAFSGLREPNAENFFRKSQIYAANLETGEIRQITHRNGTNGSPAYSPDGKMIAFMSADSVDHSAWAETKLWVMNADGSERARRVGQPRPADLRRVVGDGRYRRVLQRRERRVEEPVLRDDRRASSIP